VRRIKRAHQPYPFALRLQAAGLKSKGLARQIASFDFATCDRYAHDEREYRDYWQIRGRARTANLPDFGP
jgi:hypothetical protein